MTPISSSLRPPGRCLSEPASVPASHGRRRCHAANAFIAVFAVLASRGLPAAAQDSQPRIAKCRIGFAGAYKVGHWTPVWVDVAVIDQLPVPLQIDVTANDSDGIAATATTDVLTGEAADGPVTAELATQVGHLGNTVSITLRNGSRAIDRAELRPGTSGESETAVTNLPANGELLVAIGTQSFGWQVAFPDREAETSRLVRRAVQVKRVAELPASWFGYDTVDVLVLSVGDGRLCQELAADVARIAALRQWVELGGRLVILCDGAAAQELFAQEKPLAAFAPGEFLGVTGLSQTGLLEQFAESAEPIARRDERIELPIPRFADVGGRIEAYAGQQPTDLPLVVRRPFGLGEIAFAGVDLSAPPLERWPGRSAFLHALLRPYLSKEDVDEAPHSLMTLGYNDLSGALRQRLGSSFPNVTTISFSAVASLAVAYLLILGPGDYWLVHKVIRRPGAAWITFPLLVLATSAGAYTLASWSKSTAGPRVNQVQLIDYDAVSRRARGTYWGVLYSPESRRYDLSLAPPAGDSAAQTLLSNWGLAGSGIGGLDSRGVDVGMVEAGYRFAPDLSALEGVPMLTASTKSLLGRWTTPTEPPIQARLADDDELVVGTVANRTAGPLHNVRLLYGSWAYRLGDFQVGEEKEIGPDDDAIHVRTLVARSAGIAVDQLSDEFQRTSFFFERASSEELLNLMMFYEAAGGQSFAQLPNRYQSYCDLSRLLQLGRAILVAEAPGPGRRLDVDGQLPDGAEAAQLVLLRFVLPVEKE